MGWYRRLILATTGMCTCLCLVDHMALEEESGKWYTNMLTQNSQETLTWLHGNWYPCWCFHKHHAYGKNMLLSNCWQMEQMSGTVLLTWYAERATKVLSFKNSNWLDNLYIITSQWQPTFCYGQDSLHIWWAKGFTRYHIQILAHLIPYYIESLSFCLGMPLEK